MLSDNAQKELWVGLLCMENQSPTWSVEVTYKSVLMNSDSTKNIASEIVCIFYEKRLPFSVTVHFHPSFLLALQSFVADRERFLEW